MKNQNNTKALELILDYLYQYEPTNEYKIKLYENELLLSIKDKDEN